MVSGVGADRARAAGTAASRFHDLRVVVTDKAVFDATGPDGTLRLRSVHPGVTVEEVQEATGFDIDAAGVGVTRAAHGGGTYAYPDRARSRPAT